MPAFSDDLIVVNNYASNHGVRISSSKTILSQFDAAFYVFFMYIHDTKVVNFEFSPDSFGGVKQLSKKYFYFCNDIKGVIKYGKLDY